MLAGLFKALNDKIRIILCLTILCVVGLLSASSGFHCPQGDPVTANLGEGVIMRSCMWQNDTQQLIRVGPFELVKHGILIVKTQTNMNGQVHGRFTSWTDDGVILKDGEYQNGHKHGAWVETDADGVLRNMHYDRGELVQP